MLDLLMNGSIGMGLAFINAALVAVVVEPLMPDVVNMVLAPVFRGLL